MAKDVLLEELNPQQREAVLHSQGPLLILAGAGSGKTRVIGCRFSYLAKKKKHSPSSILTVTLTNRAGEEMKENISRHLDCDHRQNWIGTFHSHCNRILRKEIKALGFKPDFVIYDEDDQSSLIRHILKEFNIYEALYKGVASRISILKASLISPEDFLSQGDGFSFDEKLGRVYLRYQDELRRSNSLDYDDLVMLTVRLFKENPKVLHKYQAMFPAILVDEFQDTNRAQMKLLQQLTGKQKNLCVAGDDDQSIYKSRGCDICNILNFEKEFPGTKVIKLGRSYRSSGNILKVSSSVIAKNIQRKPKNLQTENLCGEKVCYCNLGTEDDEAKYVSRAIKDLYLKSNFEYNNFAVFYRANLQTKALEDALREENIPYQVIGGVNFYHRKEVKDILAYMRLALNNNDNVSLRRIINSPPRGIGSTTISKIEQEAKKNSLSLFRSLKSMLQANAVAASFKDKLADFVRTIEEFSARSYRGASDMIKDIVEKTGYLDELEEERIQSILQLASSAENIPPRDFIDRISLTTPNDDTPSGGAVTLMPLHNAKGMEFPVVFIIGIEEGILPYFKAFDNAAEMQEERRLFYVGMTRARNMLYMSSVKRRRVYSKIQEQEPSRFFSDMPKDCCIWVERYQQKEKAVMSPLLQSAARKTPSFIVGSRVKHPAWGVGIVRDCCGEGEEAKVTVNFPGIGLKRLAAKLANLERI
ncbi:MAG TPA: UvrD-helicase domain-containing protein [Dissulfurispiraceae bacterium]|nr:UvrD-helicase domain-containing protein [Dissulfurispiraceae bacterium]